MQRVLFKFNPPVSGVNFSNDMSIPQDRVNMSETEHETTFETSKLLTSRMNPIPPCLGKVLDL